MKTPVKQYAYIFDIDGTIADTAHRQHYMEAKDKNWPAFYNAMVNDPPVSPVVRVLESLKEAGYAIVLVSGRPDDYREQTETWLKENWIRYNALYMRKAKDYRADDIIKLEIYKEKIEPHYDIIGIFEDRKRVKRMWVKEGIFTFDVNQLDREF